MSLKNTDFIYGLVIYTGHETKVYKNSSEARYKKSRLDKFTDNAVKWLFIIQIFFTFIVGVIAWFPYERAANCRESQKCIKEHSVQFVDKYDNPAYYLEFNLESAPMRIIKIMCTWLLLFVNLVPISLMISLEVVKYFQAMFM